MYLFRTSGNDAVSVNVLVEIHLDRIDLHVVQTPVVVEPGHLFDVVISRITAYVQMFGNLIRENTVRRLSRDIHYFCFR